MSKPPPYFRKIERKTVSRWEQLDSDPDLAGPWKQLFKQVKSPHHVISELLQNADDAGASSASIQISHNTFSFSHNGGDFTEEQFASLCKFGYSNKRSLHTIGFRGIGFKSTFSLGDQVELLTPTLGVAFHAKQFTRPLWNGNASEDGQTTVRINLKDGTVKTALKSSIQQWVTSPVSILFFKSLQEIFLNGIRVRKIDLGDGPTKSTRRFNIEVDNRPPQELLLIESGEEHFPNHAMREIREERNLDTEGFTMPPCKIEIVLGLSGQNRFFVVLPTGYEPDLPFSVNGPFIQDPARFGIKDPETSPTNQWLIERAAILAGNCFKEWISNPDLSLEERSKAYELCPADKPSYFRRWNSADYDYAEGAIRQSFFSRIEKFSILSVTGETHPAGSGIHIPETLHGIWDEEALSDLFVSEDEVLLSPFVSASAIRSLENRSWIDSYTNSQVIERFVDLGALPHPGEWEKLSILWEFIETFGARSGQSFKEIPIHPVKKEDSLAAGSRVIRTATRFGRFSKADADFLLGQVKQIDHNWLDWIAEQKKHDSSDHISRVISLCGLQESARPEFLASQAANNFFANEECVIDDAIRIAHIFASIDAEVPDNFYFVCKDDGMLTPDDHVSMADRCGIAEFMSEDWIAEHCLHDDYFSPSETCSSERWLEWAKSPKSRLWVGLPLVKNRDLIDSRDSLEKRLIKHNGHPAESYRYKRNDFEFVTYDFPQDVISAISSSSEDPTKAWSALLLALLDAPELVPNDAFASVAYQRSGRGSKERLDCGQLLPSWLLRFQSIPCLPDSRGDLHTPSELMLRNPDTEAVRDIETFVKADLDNHRTFPILKALGVRSAPSDFQTVIDRVKAFQQIPGPSKFLPQIQKLYEAMDRISLRCDRETMAQITEQFSSENLILTAAGTWANSRIVSVHPDVEGSQQEESVHSLFRDYRFWQRIGVLPSPSIERAIDWINDLPRSKKMSAEDIQRLRNYLKRDPERIWETTGHWLAMDGSWAKTGSLSYRISMQSLVKTTDLFPDILKKCADLRTLNNEQLCLESFTGLQDLSGAISLRTTDIVEIGNADDDFKWVACFGSFLKRINLGDESRTEKIRAAGTRLESSTVVICEKIEITPLVSS